MPKVTYLGQNGQTATLDLIDGQTIMEGAVVHGINGILAECGGSCMCATCHIYIEDGPIDILPPMSEDEDVMLSELATDRRDNSRLACQVHVSKELSGLVVRVAQNT